MNKEKINQYYIEFLKTYDSLKGDEIWKSHCKTFKEFWYNRVLKNSKDDLADEEIDEIVRILDRNGKGNRKGTEAVARVMIPQGAWRRMFNQIHTDRNLSQIITAIFEEKDSQKKAGFINKLYEHNKGNKNSLTGSSGNAISAMLAVNDPFNLLGMVSLKDRFALMNWMEIIIKIDEHKTTVGEKIVKTNEAILKVFNDLGIICSARTITRFCYYIPFRDLWRNTKDKTEDEIELEEEPSPSAEQYLFLMESQLEDFIIENWDKISFCKDLELIEEEDEIVSQQYRTTIGRIDILAKEKKTDRYVVIELKKNQTSDDTIGQLTRYMGWIEENKSKGKPTRGIIIAAKPDERLRYAMKKVKDIELYIYKVDFKIEKKNE